MATSPKTDPSVAPTIMPALEAGKQITDGIYTLFTDWRLCYVKKNTLLSFYCVHTGDNLQVNGAAVRAGSVAGSAHVLPWHAFSEVIQPEGAMSLVCKTTTQLHIFHNRIFMLFILVGLVELL